MERAYGTDGVVPVMRLEIEKDWMTSGVGSKRVQVPSFWEDGEELTQTAPKVLC